MEGWDCATCWSPPAGCRFLRALRSCVGSPPHASAVDLEGLSWPLILAALLRFWGERELLTGSSSRKPRSLRVPWTPFRKHRCSYVRFLRRFEMPFLKCHSNPGASLGGSLLFQRSPRVHSCFLSAGRALGSRAVRIYTGHTAAHPLLPLGCLGQFARRWRLPSRAFYEQHCVYF